jgi:hypothetical protein
MKIEILGVYPFKEKDSDVVGITLIQSEDNNIIFNKLKASTSKFLNYLIQNVIKKGDKYLEFNSIAKEAYMKYANIQHHATINSCIKDLKNNSIIANTNVKFYYWINTNIIK